MLRGESGRDRAESMHCDRRALALSTVEYCFQGRTPVKLFHHAQARRQSVNTSPRLDSLAVLFGAVGVWLGYRLADPLVGPSITLAILSIVGTPPGAFPPGCWMCQVRTKQGGTKLRIWRAFRAVSVGLIT